MDNSINAFDQIDEYAKKIDMVTQLDVTNVLDKQLSAPNVKHEWIYKLVQHKRKLLELMEKKENYIAAKYGENPLGVSKAAIKFKAESDIDILKLNREIRHHELLVEYLDMAVNKIFSQMGFDFKNLVELMKMENL